jgi:hypothetical protein
MVDNYKILDGHKYMWDGYEYKDEGEAKNAAESYRKEGFDVRIVHEDNYLVYTRREVKEVKVEGPPPP